MGETGGPGKQDVDSERNRSPGACVCWQGVVWKEARVVGRSGQRVVWGRSTGQIGRFWTVEVLMLIP